MTAVAVSAAISAFLIVFIWIFTNRIAKSISEPIVDLCNKTKLVGKGDFTVRALNSETEEVRILSKNFNQMVRRIEQLVEDVTKEQMNLRKTELELLQSQINPIFCIILLIRSSGLRQTDRMNRWFRWYRICPHFSGNV